MAALYDDKLKNLLELYIDSEKNVDSLKQSLKLTSADSRYELLMNVRGVTYSVWTGLHISVWNNDIDLIRCMISGFTSEQTYKVLTLQESFGNTPLSYAIFKRQPETVKLLYSSLPVEYRFELLTLRGEGAMEGQREIDKFKPAQRFNIREDTYGLRRKDRWAPVHMVAKYGHIGVVDYLLEGLTPEQKIFAAEVKILSGTHLTTLHLAGFFGTTEVVKQFFKSLTQLQRFELVQIQSDDNCTALHAAGRFGQTETVRQLLDDLTQQKRFDLVRMQKDDKGTALHLAGRYGHTETIRQLLDDLTQQQRFELVRIPGQHNWTALHAAGQCGHTETVRQLLNGLTQQQRFELVKLPINNNWTSLHLAALCGQTNTAKQMLEDLTGQQKFTLLKSKNSHKDTVAHVAHEGNHTETLLIILSLLPSYLRENLLTIPNEKGKKLSDRALQLFCDAADVMGAVTAKYKSQLETVEKELRDLKTTFPTDIFGDQEHAD